jgi:hypothetical protein
MGCVSRIAVLCGIAGGVLTPGAIQAAEWDITPRLGVDLTYSDNIDLDPPGEEEDGYVVRLRPALSASGRGGRMDLDLLYAPDIRESNSERDFDRITHRLQASADAELIEDSLFLRGDASIFQQLSARDDRVSATGIADSGREVRTFSLSPEIRQHLGTYADVRTVLRYAEVDNARAGVSDTTTQSVDFEVDSGRGTPTLDWQLSYRYQDTTGARRNDTTFESGSADVSWRLLPELALTAEVRHADNALGRTAGGTDRGDLLDSRNDTLVRAGITWFPGARTRLSALAGPDNWTTRAAWSSGEAFSLNGSYGEAGERTVYDVTTSWTPSRRLSTELRYGRRELGLNSNDTFSARIDLRQKRTRWGLDYRETTSTTQLLQLQQDFVRDPDTGLPVVDDEGFPLLTDPVLADLGDQVFVRKRLQASVERSSRKNDLRLRVFDERRVFADQADDEHTYGLSGRWLYRFSGKGSVGLDLTWRRIGFEDAVRGDAVREERRDDLYTVDLTLRERFTRHLTGRIILRRTQRESERADLEYEENALQLTVNWTL